MATEKNVTFEIVLPPPTELNCAQRAELEFIGAEHGGPSYEARVFLNNPDAGPDTPESEDSGYVGTFHVYGLGLSTRKEGAGAEAIPTAVRATSRTVDAADALRKAARERQIATVTVVPVLPGDGPPPDVDAREFLRIQDARVRLKP